ALQEARAQIPDNFVVYDGATFLIFEDKIEPVVGSSTSAKVSTTATLQAFLFDLDSLTEKLAATQATALSKIPFNLPNLDALTVELSDKAKINAATDKSVALLITGTTTAIANLDTKALAAALAGKPKTEAQAIFGQFPGIQSAEIKLTPLWLSNFPKEEAQNQVEVLPDGQASLTSQ